VTLWCACADLSVQGGMRSPCYLPSLSWLFTEQPHRQTVSGGLWKKTCAKCSLAFYNEEETKCFMLKKKKNKTLGDAIAGPNRHTYKMLTYLNRLTFS
jgi:hypothetical protein